MPRFALRIRAVMGTGSEGRGIVEGGFDLLGGVWGEGVGGGGMI